MDDGSSAAADVKDSVTFTRGETPEPEDPPKKRRRKPSVKVTGRTVRQRAPKELGLPIVAPARTKRELGEPDGGDGRGVADVPLTASEDLLRVIEQTAATFADVRKLPSLYNSMDRTALVATAILTEELLRHELNLSSDEEPPS